MIFLIEYDRSEGRLVSCRAFSDAQRAEAEDVRLQIELEHHRNNLDREVVLLEADTEAAIRKTHRRYFEDLRQILESGRDEALSADRDPFGKQ